MASDPKVGFAFTVRVSLAQLTEHTRGSQCDMMRRRFDAKPEGACASPDRPRRALHRRESPIHLPAARARPVGSVDRALAEAPSVSRVRSCAEPATASAFLTRGAESELIRAPLEATRNAGSSRRCLDDCRARGRGRVNKAGGTGPECGGPSFTDASAAVGLRSLAVGGGGAFTQNIRPGDSDFSLFPCE